LFGRKNSIPYFLIIAFAAVLWLPWLLAKGMFMDGMYNAILAQNLAHSISTFWAPQTNDYSHPAYWNNPPLSMLLLGYCYQIFGDHFSVERIYSLACALSQLGLISLAWRIFWKDEFEIRKYDWLPCLLWLISPLTSWCYSNNLMENTMSIFTTLALISFLLFFRYRKQVFLLSLAGAVFIFLACITKGPTGLFPLVIPFLFIWIEKENWWKILAHAAMQIAFSLVLFSFVFSLPEPKFFLHQYLTLQLLPVVTHQAVQETKGTIIFREMLIMLLPFLILALGVVYAVKSKKLGFERSHIKSALVFLLIGLSASLPIALSMKQRKFYLLPSLPMFILGFSIFILPLIKVIEQRVSRFVTESLTRLIKVGCVLIVFGSLGLSFYNKNQIVRDKDMLGDIENVLPILKNDTAVCADWQLYGEWSLRAYCTRYYNKKMYMPDRISETRFYMTKPGLKGDKLSLDAPKVYSGKTFDLYKMLWH
jgi:hypothetical protein